MSTWRELKAQGINRCEAITRGGRCRRRAQRQDHTRDQHYEHPFMCAKHDAEITRRLAPLIRELKRARFLAPDKEDER